MTVELFLVTNSKREAKTRDLLLTLLRRYDLSKWQFTNQVRIEEGSRPHSHPVLTLNTRHSDDAILLATYLHEQIHWFVEAGKEKAVQAMEDLRRLYRSVAVGAPMGGQDEFSTYLHFIVCYLEYVALIELLGYSEAERVMNFLRKDHYTEIYSMVIRDFDQIGEVVKHHDLMPMVARTR